MNRLHFNEASTQAKAMMAGATLNDSFELSV